MFTDGADGFLVQTTHPIYACALSKPFDSSSLSPLPCYSQTFPLLFLVSPQIPISSIEFLFIKADAHIFIMYTSLFTATLVLYHTTPVFFLELVLHLLGYHRRCPCRRLLGISFHETNLSVHLRQNTLFTDPPFLRPSKRTPGVKLVLLKLY